MSRRTWIAAVTAVLMTAVTAVIIINFVNTKWRPDQDNWPPAQVWDDLEGMPADYTPPPPQTDVIWSDYRSNFKGAIDRAGDEGDCAALDRYFGEAMNNETSDVLALTYIDKWIDHLNCPGKEGETDPGPPSAFGLCEPEGTTGKTPGGTKVICKADKEGTLRWQKRD